MRGKITEHKMLKLLIIFYLVFALSGLGLAAEDNLEVKGTIQTDSLILIGGSDFPATPVKGEVFYHSGQNKFYTFDGQNWSGANDRTVATKIVAAYNSFGSVSSGGGPCPGNGSPCANPKADYVCDGTDDQQTIQTAIDALGNNKGGVVYLLEGTYNLSGPIVFDDGIVSPADGIDDSGKSLIGAGKATVFRRASGTNNILNATNVQSLLISQLSLNGNSLGGDGLFFSGVTFSKIDKLWIENLSGGGMFIRLANSSANNTIFNCHLQGSCNTAIFLNSASNNNLILGNKLIPGGSGIAIYSSQNNLISNNRIQSNGMGAYGIFLFSSSGNIISQNSLDLQSIANFGLWLQLSSNNFISGNNIQRCTQNHLYIYDSSNNNLILGNNLRLGGGLVVDSSSSNVIRNNFLSGMFAGANGIEIGSTFFSTNNSNLILSNRILDSAGLGFGINIGDSAINTYLSGNLIESPDVPARLIRDAPNIPPPLKNTTYTDRLKLTLEPASACPGAGCSGLASGGTLTPTGPTSYLRLNPSNNVNLGNPNIAPGKASGDLLILENISPTWRVRFQNNQGVRLSVTSPPFQLNLFLNDTLTFIWDGSVWVEIGYGDN